MQLRYLDIWISHQLDNWVSEYLDIWLPDIYDLVLDIWILDSWFLGLGNLGFRIPVPSP